MVLYCKTSMKDMILVGKIYMKKLNINHYDIKN